MMDNYHKLLHSPVGIAVLDLIKDGRNTYIVSRINVPMAHRGKGIGRELLTQACSEADKEKITLKLIINAYGRYKIDPSYRDLEQWYHRNGFRWNKKIGYMVRKPR